MPHLHLNFRDRDTARQTLRPAKERHFQNVLALSGHNIDEIELQPVVSRIGVQKSVTPLLPHAPARLARQRTTVERYVEPVPGYDVR